MAVSPRKQGNGPCFGLVSRMAGFRVHVRRQPWGYPAEGSSRERNCTCKSKEQRRAWVYNPLAKSWNPKTFDDKSRAFSLPSSTSRPDFLAKPLYGPASHFFLQIMSPDWLCPILSKASMCPRGAKCLDPISSVTVDLLGRSWYCLTPHTAKGFSARSKEERLCKFQENIAPYADI